jgi:hypothetical protein
MARIAVKQGIALPARLRRDFKAMCRALGIFARTDTPYRLRPHTRYEINTILHQQLMLNLQAWMPEEFLHCTFCGRLEDSVQAVRCEDLIHHRLGVPANDRS